MDRSTLVLSEDSWHVKLYRFWQDRGELKNDPSYKENLCHYWRAVVIWAPLHFFMGYEIKGKTWLRPATIVLAIVAIAGLITALAINPVNTLIAIGEIIGTMILVFLGFVVISWMDDNPRKVKSFFTKIGHAIKIVVWSWLKYPVRGIVWLGRKFARGVVAIGDSKVWWILPAIVIAIVLGLYIYVLTIDTIGILIGTAVVLGIVGVVGSVIGIVAYASNRSTGTKVKRVEPSLTKVTWEFAKAKKHKICPFIEIEESQEFWK